MNCCPVLENSNASYLGGFTIANVKYPQVCLCLAEEKHCVLPQYETVFRSLNGLISGGIISSFMWLGIFQVVKFML